MLKKLIYFTALISIAAVSVYLMYWKSSNKNSKQSITFEDHINDVERFRSSGHYTHAYKSLKSALKLKNNDPDLLWEVSSMAQTLGKNPESISYAHKAWVNGLKNRDVILRIFSLNKSFIRSNLDEQEKMLLMCNKLSDPEQSVLTKGDLLIQFDRFDQAWELWKSTFKISPSSKIAERIANCHIIQKDYQTAIEFLAQCYRDKLLKEKGLLSYSRLYLMAGRYDAAEIVLNEALEQYQSSKKVKIESAFCDFLLGNNDQCLTKLDELENSDLKDENSLLINSRLIRANVYFAQRDFQSIASLKSELLSDNPKLEGERILYDKASKPGSRMKLDKDKIDKLLPKSGLAQLLMVQYYHYKNQDDEVIAIANSVQDPVLKSSHILTAIWVNSLMNRNQHILAEQLIKRQLIKGVYIKSYFDNLQLIYSLNKKNMALQNVIKLKRKYFPDNQADLDLLFSYLGAQQFSIARKFLSSLDQANLKEQEFKQLAYLCDEDFVGALKNLQESSLSPQFNEQCALLITQFVDLKKLNNEDKIFLLDHPAVGLSLAYRYLYESELESAKNLFDQLKSKVECEIESQVGLCLTHLYSNNFDEAKLIYDNLSTHNLKSVNFIVLKINYEILNENGKQALALLEKLPLYYRSFKQVKLLTVKAMMLEGQWVKAMNVFNSNGLELSSSLREKALLAECYIHLGEYSLAANYIKENKLEYNASPLITNFSVNEFLNRNDIEKAKEILNKTTFKSDGFQMVLAQVAIDLKEKNYDRVITSLESEIEKNPSAFYYWASANIYNDTFLKVKENFKTSKVLNDDILRLAILCESRKLHNEASFLYKQYLPVSNQNAETHNNIAWNLFLDGQFEAALHNAEKAHKLSPHDQNILHTYSSVLNANKLYKKTIATLKPNQQNTFNYKDPKLLYNLAESYRNMNQADQALTTYKACLESLNQGFGEMSDDSEENIKNYIAQIEGNLVK